MENIFLVSTVVLWLAVMALGVVVFALARQIGLLHERINPAGALLINQELEVGEAPPALKVQTLGGDLVSIGGLREKSLLMFFLSPTCPMCKALLPVIEKSQAAENTWLDVLYASDGDGDDHGAFAKAHNLDAAHYVVSEALGRAYGVAKLPYAVLLDEEGRVASMGLVNSREHLESLFNAKETGVVSIQEFFKNGASKEKTAIGA